MNTSEDYLEPPEDYLEPSEDILSIRDEDLYCGDKNAQITLIQYDSLTSPHCKAFHSTIFPTLRREFIDSGRVLFVIRALPTDSIAFRLAMAVMCGQTNKDKMKIRSLIFNYQDVMFKKFSSSGISATSSHVSEEILSGFADMIEAAGYERERIDSCMDPEKSHKIAEFILNQVASANKSFFELRDVPTVLLNGCKYSGLNTLNFWKEKIEAELYKDG